MLIYICDDDEIHQKNISNIIKRYCLGRNIALDIKCFLDGEKLLFGIQEEVKPIDAFFLDIELHKENGMEIAKEIKKQYSHSNIVYISSHDKYVFQVFETEPMDYLLKPFNEENVRKVMNRICEKVSYNRTIQLMVSRKNIELNVDLILYIESAGCILNVHTKDNIYQTYNKMNEMLDKLNEISTSFVRIHRSVIVNYDHVKNIRGDDIFLDNGTYLVISRKYREPFKKFSMQYIENKVNEM